MNGTGTSKTGSTRRGYLRRSAAAVAAGGLLAGCAGEDAPADDADSTADGTATDAADATATDDADSWGASLAPVGEVTFESEPESVAVYDLLHADLAVAYGRADAVNSLGFDAAVDGATLSAYYERLDGVETDWGDLAQLNDGNSGVNVDAELLYELDSDLHLIDPALVTSFDGWEREDTAEIADNVGPWFGNYFSRTHGEPPAAWADAYEYHTVWETAERVAPVFRAEDRYEALAEVRADLLATIEEGLPPASERPTVAVTIFMDGTFYPTAANAPGYATAHVRPFGVEDAFAGEEITFETSYDYEAMLEFDPDVILHPYGLASYYSVPDVRTTLSEHAVGSELTAVAEDRVYPSGNPMQGPIVNLFQTEMTAKQLFPERFGAWPEYDGGPYPEIPAEERLFDRDRVAEVVAGDV
ncbi:ABC transporter substrate-binding protein [Haloparvum alkalitolerans]|uniref:ABC transporter substrate-binding protein n=1 Tax=Haloparvum alkalitolerans TaxID=1042953 RepID=UPI003CFB2281